MKGDVADTSPRPEDVTGMDEPESKHILAFFEGARGASGKERGEWKGQGAHPLVDCGSVAVGSARTRLELQPSQSQSSMIDWVSFLSQADDFSS